MTSRLIGTVPILPPVRPNKGQSGVLQAIDHSVAGLMTAQSPVIRPSSLRVATHGQQAASFLTPLQRCSRRILQPQPTEREREGKWERMREKETVRETIKRGKIREYRDQKNRDHLYGKTERERKTREKHKQYGFQSNNFWTLLFVFYALKNGNPFLGSTAVRFSEKIL